MNRDAFVLFVLFVLVAACNAKAGTDRAPVATMTASASAAPTGPSPSSANAAEPAAPTASVAQGGASASPSGAPPSSSSAVAAIADAAVSDHPLARYRTVVHVGDSMVGYHMGLQLELGKMWKAIGVHYEALTVTAAGIHSFATEKHVEKLVKAKNPDLVIVQIGTNNLTVPHPEAYIADLKSIVAQTQTGAPAGGRRCVWIGPIPLEQPEHGMRAVLRDNVAPTCVFYDSWDLDLKRQTDNIHPTQPASKKWANAFWEFAKTNLASNAPDNDGGGAGGN